MIKSLESLPPLVMTHEQSLFKRALLEHELSVFATHLREYSQQSPLHKYEAVETAPEPYVHSAETLTPFGMEVWDMYTLIRDTLREIWGAEWTPVVEEKFLKECGI